MSRKRKHDDHENHERWLVSYADFITLLFAFFVVMYATSTNDLEKQQKFEESVRASLKLAVVGPTQGGADGGSAIISELMNPIDQFPRRGGPAEVQDFLDRQIKRTFTKEELEKSIVQVRSDSRGARLVLTADAFFLRGDSRLKKNSVDVMDKIASILQKTDRQVVIEGHTDGATSGWELAGSRATSVKRYFEKYHDLDSSRLAAVSYADQRHLAPNTTEENKARNRRIEILITADSAD